jgi:hypothetical protein
MNATLSVKSGRVVLEIVYNPAVCDWSEAISTGLAIYGIQRHQVATVIATPVSDTFSHKTKSESTQAWFRNMAT